MIGAPLGVVAVLFTTVIEFMMLYGGLVLNETFVQKVTGTAFPYASVSVDVQPSDAGSPSP